MSRKNSRVILRVNNKNCNRKHNSPRELDLISGEIEKLEFITEPIGKSKWKPSSIKTKKKINIVGFDYLKRSFSANLYGEFYQQKLFIKVDVPKDENLLERKCLEMKIEVKERQENCYYYNELRKFYEEKIVNTVKSFYNE